MSIVSKQESSIRNRHHIINKEELDEWEDATESFEAIINSSVKISNAMKILQANINILKDGYYKNYSNENNGTGPSNSLDATIERTLKIVEESCNTIRSISIGEDVNSKNGDPDDEDNISRRVIFGNEDEQTLIMHSREPTSSR